ncbi:hypothetical protein ACT7CT_11000 [Bacillus sanguinis]
MNYYKKVEVACLEQEGVGSPDEEALFASQEGVKRPTVLATEHSSRWNWIIKKEWKQQRFIKTKGRASFFQNERSGS